MRSEKIYTEKNTLEMQTSKGSENQINEKTFRKITAKISHIRGLYDKKRVKSNNQTADPKTQLIEIETHINKVLKFLQLAKIADGENMKKILQVLFADAK